MSSIRFIVACISLLTFSLNSVAQSYTSYFTGNNQNWEGNAKGGICLMGGATENDSAMTWFLQQANGGDILVLRASGSDGYNNYLYSDLGIDVHSVETIVFHEAAASYDSYVLERIQAAEAIWFAGGDQWNYIDFWRNTPVDSIIRSHIKLKNIVIGGTSAGMAILGDTYFTAEYGTITSNEALMNPFHPNLTLDTTLFLNDGLIESSFMETHFDNPDRKGRLVSFLARSLQDWNRSLLAIACEEYTAVCIDSTGKASVYGDYPDYEDYVWFVQVNPQLNVNYPETCEPGMPLEWYRDSLAIKACRIPANPAGNFYFDLNDRSSESGGEWFHWFVHQGVLHEINGSPIQSNPIQGFDTEPQALVNIHPNPFQHEFSIHWNLSKKPLNCAIFSPLGELIDRPNLSGKPLSKVLTNGWKPGIYFLQIRSESDSQVIPIIKH